MFFTYAITSSHSFDITCTCLDVLRNVLQGQIPLKVSTPNTMTIGLFTCLKSAKGKLMKISHVLSLLFPGKRKRFCEKKYNTI